MARLKTENEMNGAIWEHVAIPGVNPPEDAAALEEAKRRLLSGEMTIEEALNDSVAHILINKGN